MSYKLTDEEAQLAVDKWMEEDFAVRAIRLGRGDWDDIIGVIASAQVKKLIEHLDDIAEDFEYPDIFLDGVFIKRAEWQELKKEIEE